MNTLSLFLGLLLAPSIFASVSYSGYKVFRTIPEDADEVDFLHETAMSSEHFDIWKEARRHGDHMDIMVDHENIEYFEVLISSRGIKYHIMMEDVGAVINQEMENIRRHKENSPNNYHDYTVYHTLAEIEGWLVGLEANYSSVVTLFDVGPSYEGRTIRGAQISTGGTGKPAVYLDSNIHAREWIAVATTTYMMGTLVDNYNNGDKDVTNLLNSLDIHYVPVFNVDGYEYSWTNDRMWRKTRSPNSGSSYVGTDPNRNWKFFHCKRGSSTSPWSEAYCGTRPWSEVEVRGVRDYLLGIENLQLYMSFHSYSQWYMTPWAHYTTPPADHRDVMAFCQRGVDALIATHGAVFECGTVQSFVGATSGSSVDWVKARIHPKYNFGPELRDTGYYGFLLPAEQIIPSGEENYNAFIEFLKALKEEFAP